MSKWNDMQRQQLAEIYGRLFARFDFDHVIRRIEAGWLGRAARARVESGAESHAEISAHEAEISA